jgi:hypothetical protein
MEITPAHFFIAAQGIQAVISMALIIFGVYMGYKMGRPNNEISNLIFKDKEMPNKDALDDEDYFTGELNLEGMEDPEERLRTT